MVRVPGVLYVVATPIGNLEDLTFRALRILREVDVIAAEDTRRTSKLLAHYQISKPLISLREHNEAREAVRLIDRLASGASVALVSDAGTPAIADPGARLVRAVREAGIRVVPVPGASAITAALSVSGLDAREFVFMGFPPAAGTERRSWFDRLAQEPRVVVFFEAPHRARRTLTEAANLLVNRHIIINREITKINEQFVVCHSIASSDDVLDRGEFVMVVSPSARPDLAPQGRQSHQVLIGRLLESDLFDDNEVATILSSLDGLPHRSAAKIVKKYKISIKQQNTQRA